MPNIEIHGFDDPAAEEAKIRKIFEEWTCYQDMVITRCPVSVSDFEGEASPFLRVLDTSQLSGPRLAKRLMLAGYDVEFILLRGFLAKCLYTLEEIAQEVAEYEKKPDIQKIILANLKAGDFTGAIDCLKRAAASLRQNCPNYEHWRGIRVKKPNIEDRSPEANICRLNRLDEMLNSMDAADVALL